MAQDTNTPFPSSAGAGNTAPVDGAASAAHNAVDKASATIKPTVEKGEAAAHQAINAAAEAVEPAADWIKEKAKVAREAQDQFVESASALISAQPITAIVVALAVGYLFGRGSAGR